MRILVLTPLLPDPRSSAGGALVMYEQLRRLARRHDVRLLSLVTAADLASGATDAIEAAGVESVLVPRDYARSRLLRQSALAVRWLAGGRPLRVEAFRSTAMQRTIAATVARERFDVVHVEDAAMGTYQFPSGVPRLLIEHEVRAGAGPAGAARRLTSDAARWPAYQRAVWRKFGAIQVFTERDARAIEDSAPDVRARVFVNPFGASIPSAQSVTDEAGREIVFVGGFQHLPNVDAARWLADDIFPEVLRSVPDARLTIVGSDPPRAVRSLAGPHVAVTGRVPDTDPYLRRAAVVAAPLREGGGMRVKVLQAMAMGKPVVATPLAAEGLRIDAGPPALRVAGTAQAFARALVELLASPIEQSALGARARAYVEREHDWDRYVARIETAYAALVSGG